MTNEEMTKRINEIDNEREQLKREKEKYLRQLETIKLKIGLYSCFMPIIAIV